MEYNSLNNIDDLDKSVLTSVFQRILLSIKQISVNKTATYLRYIPEQCRMHYNSLQNKKSRDSHPQKFHPVKPQRGEIYNAFITEGVGSELCGNHLVVIIQNKKANIYSEKVNVLPVEGNGTKINPNYHVQLSSSDLSFGSLDKDPSRIIVTDITTIDKARLGRKIGQITPACMTRIEKLLRKQLEL